jgi:hypothetical protein
MNDPVVVEPTTVSPSADAEPVMDTSYITAALKPSMVKEVAEPSNVTVCAADDDDVRAHHFSSILVGDGLIAAQETRTEVSLARLKVSPEGLPGVRSALRFSWA